MVGVRVAPDNNDIVVWKLDEANAPFVNSSTSTSAPSHAVSDLSTLSGTVFRQQPSPFAANGTNSAVQFTGNQSGSPRNFISGANNFLPQPPITVSAWVNLRVYNNGLTQHGVAKQTTTGVWSGTTFSSLNLAQNEGYASKSNWFDFSVTNNAANNGGNANVSSDINIVIGTWCHIGLTYDGTTVLSYINGNNVGSAVASPGGNIYYSGTPGPWFIGAIPSGSGSPEECIMSYCDIRIANVVRPLSYFANIYNNAITNSGTNLQVVTKYYKMRAYDISCATPTAVYWVDTQINYNNAPAAPCGSLGPIEVIESWPVPNG